jgi:prepilin-type N-terminal cleavage/methylation domain-containing protein/prepilin-type processing-associated H-X9-DG protein
MRYRQRGGFTLIELLMVVAVIAILIALLLPAVQQAREGARRMQCRNNLCQLALALHNYHAAHRVLPPGSVNETGPVQYGIAGANHFGWIAQILPQLDEANVWRQFDFSKTSYQQTPLSAPQVLYCPSVPGPGMSYAACHHDAPALIDVDNNGVQFLNSSVRLRDITDGKAHTLLLGECLGIGAGAWYQGTDSTLRHSGAGIDGAGTIDMTAYYRELSRLSALDGGAEMESEAESAVVASPMRFGSIHSGGAHFALADGSVRFISSSVDSHVLRRLGNRHDGEIVGEF